MLERNIFLFKEQNDILVPYTVEMFFI